jgi:hypothetical protein
MKSFKSVIEEIVNSVEYKTPNELSLPKFTEIRKNTGSQNPPERRFENDQSRLAGRYNSDLGTDGKMVSQDRHKKAKENEQIKAQLAIPKQKSFTLSNNKFNKLFNPNNKRQIKLKEDEWKTINSKDVGFVARRLPDGRVLLRRLEN